MEHESFEDPTIAKLLNDVFVCIKVDREERPDIDSILYDGMSDDEWEWWLAFITVFIT